VTALFGVICLSGANIGYFNRREIRWLDRILLAVAAVSLVWVSYLTSLFGLILLSIVFIKHGGIHMRLSRDSSQIRKEVEGQILKEMG
jgi:TRAP-type uncharacterized transport system fused permease subunit